MMNKLAMPSDEKLLTREERLALQERRRREQEKGEHGKRSE